VALEPLALRPVLEAFLSTLDGLRRSLE